MTDVCDKEANGRTSQSMEQHPHGMGAHSANGGNCSRNRQSTLIEQSSIASKSDFDGTSGDIKTFAAQHSRGTDYVNEATGMLIDLRKADRGIAEVTDSGGAEDI